ncbi:extracellular solute-binding protein [Anaerocolumna sedimenticola]|uniref:Extracellular solute-binding protein n=1 Tax=Anaerocolumna sedimenticola TaxID=2696063 RepID=A0A6P1TI50_9FIRM|nr:extracellular solute-binding protein [Anaerocolumna sedimenticola]QHQ60890.1 extracellular solute-binding protein [Anaerocolumna sedimenticola]
MEDNKSHVNYKKRITAAFVSVVLVLTVVLTGCGGKSSSDVQTSLTENSRDGSSAADSDSSEKETITIALQTDSFITDYNDNYLTNLIEKELGINLEIYQLPSDSTELKSKVSIMVAAGKDMPDVFSVKALSNEMILDYGSKGAFIPLNDYVNDPSKAVNFSAIPGEDKDIMLKAMTSADGNIYTLPAYEPETWNLTPYRLYINETWLNKLGLKIPATTDEYYEVLKAFVNQDPNGNGIKDEIGVYGYSTGGYGENIIQALMNAFTFYNSSVNGGLALDGDGSTVIAPFTTDEWKNGMEYMNKLYSEGLLTASIFTDDITQFKATLNNEAVNLIGSVTAGSTGNWTDADNNPNFQDMTLISPLQGPEGIAYTPYAEYSPTPAWFITSACKNPDLAFKLGDLFYRQDMSMTVRFGEEGVDWTMDEATCEASTNAFVDAGLYDKIGLVYLTNIWVENNNKFWRNCQPRYASLSTGNTYGNGTAEYNPELKTAKLGAYNYQHYYNAHPEKVLPVLHYTAEETGKISETTTNIPEYVNQSLAEFITGARSMDEWSDYLDTLNGMGLKQWLECAQTAYDRIK